jgi:hypothetical protein
MPAGIAGGPPIVSARYGSGGPVPALPQSLAAASGGFGGDASAGPAASRFRQPECSRKRGSTRWWFAPCFEKTRTMPAPFAKNCAARADQYILTIS